MILFERRKCKKITWQQEMLDFKLTLIYIQNIRKSRLWSRVLYGGRKFSYGLVFYYGKITLLWNRWKGVYVPKNPNLETDQQYRNLLNNERRIIKQRTEQIINNAHSVYNHKLTNDGKSKLSQRCNDFRLLEEKCREVKIK